MTARDDARRAVAAARAAVQTWCDDVRQEAERRLNLPPGTEAVIRDPWFLEALEISADLEQVEQRLADNTGP